MNELMKNWRLIFLFAMLLLAVLLIGFKGLKFGIDFSGGTIFQIQLEREAKNADELNQVVKTITQRLDWTGLKDTKVSSFGQKYVLVEIAETDPDKIARMQSLISRQGRFEVYLDGNTVFTGKNILTVSKDPARGYGFTGSENIYRWQVPFTLDQEGAERFRDMTFHRCSITGYTQEKGREYECDKTYFFIDRPERSIIIIPKDVYEKESNVPTDLSYARQTITFSELMSQANLNYIVSDTNMAEEDLNRLKAWHSDFPIALVHPKESNDIKAKLISLGFEVKEIEEQSAQPWSWSVTGLKTVINLTESVVHLDKDSVQQADLLYTLLITGSAGTAEDAKKELQNLTIILESGSLPIAVEAISKESITPRLGQEFLYYAALIGLLALVTVAIVLFIKYRLLRITIPIMFTSVSEALLTLGFASLIGWNLDFATIAGILAAVGTGVDDQIIITDELTRGKKEEEQEGGSLLQRSKRAFMIVVAAASTLVAAMLPIILFGFGLGKLVGFAITTIAGVLIGVLITRPAYNEIARRIIK